MKDNILVSIIVPVYNVKKYLSSCIDSILRQTYKNLQIILIDDGSTDESGVICDEYAKRDSRITVIHKINGGLSDARNVGIDNANGEYICFIDSDDFVRQTYIEDLLTAVLKHDADISVCLFEKGINDNFKKIYNQIQAEEIVLNSMDALKRLYNDELSVEMIVAWNKLYSKKLFEMVRFPIGKINEDEFTIPQLLYNANRVVIINKYDYYYFQSPNSIMRSTFKLNRLDILLALEERMKFFGDNGLIKLKNQTLVQYIYLIINFICILNEKNNKEFLDKKLLLVKKLRKNTMLLLNLKEASIKLKVQTFIFYLSPKMGVYFRKLYSNLTQRNL